MPATATSTSSARILDRYLSAAREKSAALVLRDSPTGWHWGWFANAEPPMHIVPMKAGHHHLGRIDLEDRHGNRVFKPTGKIPADVLIELAQEVELHDIEVEDAWCREAAMRGWIQPGIDALGGRLMVGVYIGQENERIRGFDVAWSKIIGQRRPVQDDVDVDVERSELIVGPKEARPIRIPLRHVVFRTRGAVVDGATITEPDFGRDQSARLQGIVDRYTGNFMPPGA